MHIADRCTLLFVFVRHVACKSLQSQKNSLDNSHSLTRSIAPLGPRRFSEIRMAASTPTLAHSRTAPRRAYSKVILWTILGWPRSPSFPSPNSPSSTTRPASTSPIAPSYSTTASCSSRTRSAERLPCSAAHCNSPGASEAGPQVPPDPRPCLRFLGLDCRLHHLHTHAGQRPSSAPTCSPAHGSSALSPPSSPPAIASSCSTASG